MSQENESKINLSRILCFRECEKKADKLTKGCENWTIKQAFEEIEDILIRDEFRCIAVKTICKIMRTKIKKGDYEID